MSGLSDKANAEPDLTPMLDMVFQLVTFFMLVINFKSAALDMSLKLPIVGSARPVDTKGKVDFLILNVNKDGELKVYNQTKDIDSYLAGEAQASMLKASKTNPDIKPGDELPTTVVIRADQGTTFKKLNRVIKACQDNGYRNFAMKSRAPQ